MPAAPLLSDEEIRERVRGLAHWEVRERTLVRSFTFANFAEAVSFVSSLVAPADEQNHHPDVTIHWNEVTLSLWTHASGGITERDLALAQTIDEMTL